MASHLTLTRRHSFSGKKNLDWFFANRKWIRTSALSLTECCWAKRALPLDAASFRHERSSKDDRSSQTEAGIRFLLLASKRSHKHAHDRNKIRRWLRAAITETEEFSQLEETMLSRGEQLLVMMRVSKPVPEVKWAVVLDDVRQIVAHLKKRTA